MAKIDREEWCSEVDDRYDWIDWLAFAAGMILLLLSVAGIMSLCFGVLWAASRVLQGLGV